MSIDNARFPLPSECRAMIQAGALVVLNHSSGKDSQAMTPSCCRGSFPAPSWWRFTMVNPCVSGWLRQGREGGKLNVRVPGFAAADNPEASGSGLRYGADR